MNRTRESGTLCPTKVPAEAGLKALKLAVAIEQEARRYNKEYGFKFNYCAPDDLDGKQIGE